MISRISLAQGDYHQAEIGFKKYMAKNQELGVIGNSIQALGYLGWVASASGDLDQAERYLDEAIRLAEKLGGGSIPEYLYVLAQVAISRRDYSKAYAYLRTINFNPSHYARRIDMTTFYTPLIPLVVQVYAVLAAAVGKMEHAAVLFGCLDAYPWLANMLPPTEREAYRQALAAVRAALSEEEFAAAWAQGQAMKARQALDYARANAPERRINLNPCLDGNFLPLTLS